MSKVSNKKLGNDFEREFCSMLSREDYWAHFISPSVTGAQPFDVIACKDNKVLAFDCKTSVKKKFSVDRLEYNQVLAFDKMIQRGNTNVAIAIKHEEKVYIVPYQVLAREGTVELNEDYCWQLYLHRELQ